MSAAEAHSPGATNDPRAGAAFTYPPADPVHERCLSCFDTGWHARDAEVAGLLADLAQARADADRYYRAAFDTPTHLRERLDRGARDYWQEFIAAAPEGESHDR